MTLFRSSRKTEQRPTAPPSPPPSPTSSELENALTEESAASRDVSAASTLCTQLDEEWRSWERRREAAYRSYCAAAQRHAQAKARVADLSKSAKVRSITFVAGAVS